MAVRVKICGLTDPAAVAGAAEAGAAYIGFVFFEKSPRNVSIERARDLALNVPVGVAKVALTVDATDESLEEILNLVPIDILQLQGRETPERVSQVKSRFGLPVMKAIGVGEASDLEQISAFETVADMILLDAKAPKGSERPGGNGHTFDWSLIADREWNKPWMLAGGLRPASIADAVHRTGATQIDVSSAVEDSPGVKNVAKIHDFIAAANAV